MLSQAVHEQHPAQLRQFERVLRTPIGRGFELAREKPYAASQASLSDLKQRITALEMVEESRRKTVGDLNRRLAEEHEELLQLHAARSGAADNQFRTASRKFANRLRPNSDRTAGFEKRIRTMVIKEFWPVLEDFEVR